jgi:hypothetical protein
VVAAIAILWLAGPAAGAQLGLQWTDNADNETGFRVERGPSSSGAFAEIATVGTNVTTYSDTTVTSGQTYCYRIQAFNGAGSSGYTNVACATVAAVPPTVTLTTTRAGVGSGTVTGTGIDCGTDCSHSAVSGATVTLTATPAAGSTFTGWSGGGCSGTGTCVLTLLANTTVTATFGLPTYSVTVTRSGTGTGTVTGTGIDCGTDCSHSVASGATVTLTATPAAGSTFTGWSGGGCSGTGTCALTLLANTTVTATFGLPSYSVTVTRSGSGTGTVTGTGIDCGADCSHSVASGTPVTLTATPAAGSTFTGWTGACGGVGSCAVTVSANTVVGATFASGPPSAALEIVAGAEPGASPRVQGFTRTGESTPTDFLAYAPSFTGGVFVALGRLDSQGNARIVTGSGSGIPGEVRAFRADGSSAGASFLPYGKSFRGGVRVAACDVDGDGTDEIVTVPGPGRRPTVAIWRLGSSQTTRVLDFGAGSNSNTRGLFVSCGDVDGDGASEIVVGYEQGGEPVVRLYRVTGTRARIVASFLAYETSFTGGVRVATADVDGDGRVELITAPGPGGLPAVHVFKVAGSVVTELTEFEGADSASTGGLHVAGGGEDALGGAIVIVSAESASSTGVRVFSVSSTGALEVDTFPAGEPGTPRGVTLGASP